LIATDSVVFSRVAVSGSGDQSGYMLGAGIRNLVNKSGDSHRADKLYEEALNAIRADTQGGTVPPQSTPTQTTGSNRANNTPLSIPVGADDATRAVYYRQKCNDGGMQGCINLGTMYRMGWGVSKDSSQASALFKKGCDGGIQEGCKFLEAVGSAPSSPKTDAAPSVATQASVSIDSIPAGADIEIDGAFVGNTPSTISIASGSHRVSVKKKGFNDWSKPLTITGGAIHLSAELESASQSAQPTENVASQSTNGIVTDGWAKPEVDQIRAMVQAIKQCPSKVSASAASTISDGPPYNVTWDVSPSQSIRAPYAGYIELTVPSSVQCSQQRRASSPQGCAIVERPQFPLVLRYEYDLSPDGVRLSKILVRRDNETQWSNRPNVSNYCWERAAQPTGR
jgi:hypothetical protein